jgi:transcriptional regulator with XRE-family HTH domain
MKCGSIAHLLRHGGRTRPPTRAALRRLREQRRISQVELARLMGVRQATISKLEHRNDMNLSTLKRFVAALGGVLEVSARFADHTIAIDVVGGEAQGSPR